LGAAFLLKGLTGEREKDPVYYRRKVEGKRGTGRFLEEQAPQAEEREKKSLCKKRSRIQKKKKRATPKLQTLRNEAREGRQKREERGVVVT